MDLVPTGALLRPALLVCPARLRLQQGLVWLQALKPQLPTPPLRKQLRASGQVPIPTLTITIIGAVRRRSIFDEFVLKGISGYYAQQPAGQQAGDGQGSA